MVRRGALLTIRVGGHHRIGVDGLRATFAEQPLRLALLDAIADGRLVAPRAPTKDRLPLSYYEMPGAVRARVWEDHW